MSGGSYDYLYSHEVTNPKLWGLAHMVERLEASHPGTRAATNARALLAGLENLERLKESLRDVFQAQEWLESCDWGPEAVEQAVEEYERR